MISNKKRKNKPNDQKKPPSVHDELAEASKLRLAQCKFWKFGKCNWGWGCRFLHGNNLSDDPRRPEYRGPPVGFTQFPRIKSASVNDDQLHLRTLVSKSKPLRNPIVQISVSNENSKKFASTMKDLLLRNSIDILLEANFQILAHETALSTFDQHKSDFIMFINGNSIIMISTEFGTTNSAPVPHQLVVEWIHRHWRTMNNNLTSEEMELMTTNDLETIIKQLVAQPTNIEDFTPTISNFQDQVRCAIASQEFDNCKSKPQDLIQLRAEISLFLCKLSLAYSTITDLPIYTNAPLNTTRGREINSMAERPNGISISLQKALLFLLGQYMTQIHVCFTSINNLLGESAGHVASTLPPSKILSSPYCFVDVASLLPSTGVNDKEAEISPGGKMASPSMNQKISVEFNKNAKNMAPIEPDISVDVRSPYTLSFRDNQDNNNQHFQRPFHP